jgi:hypothetical protein
LKDAEIYFRKAQIIYFNKLSSITDLEKAHQILQEYCLSSSKPLKQMMKFKDLETKILTEIDKRIQDKLRLISLFLKRAEKLIQQLKLKRNPT